MSVREIKTVAIIGAGASGAITAAALAAENYFDQIKVFERRATAGGTWLHDPLGIPDLPIEPGALPQDIDRPLPIPSDLPREVPPNEQFRWEKTPIYDSLTTNVPHKAMSFSDSTFPYGPFVDHQIPRQYVESYFAQHKIYQTLVLNTTVEEALKIYADDGKEQWKLTLRRHNPISKMDAWWIEMFDAVVIANGHYSVPFVPNVQGLKDYLRLFPGRVIHSKAYRNRAPYSGKRVLIVGNSSSGHEICHELRKFSVALPVYQSRRVPGRFDQSRPPQGVEWIPAIVEYRSDGTIVLEDNTVLRGVDNIIYCTGYQPSFPFWNEAANRGPLWSYETNRLVGSYQHTFFQQHRSLAIVGIINSITFRSFEYQAVAIARLFSGRNRNPLPSITECQAWETARNELIRKKQHNFHDIGWDDGQTVEWLGWLYEFAGLPTFDGDGRAIQPLTREERWLLEHVKKYPVTRPLAVKENMN